ncbi:PREDICTED: uncharacterized protein LOC108364742 [Rhagoletis zephyria]|uniref:uncharacterized protein LOC108364742 n=1 Tax=Rhagoletis zephyria TaxID=28612 RepID=UPI00081139F5|nr:PREDICTED: uncharacterized protein LOC108364742 [Rhagoletis zephyria]
MAYSTAAKSVFISIAVIITIFCSFIASVDAIRCHQCNSHLQEDCNALRLITPRAPLDDQFLEECSEPNMFCRKTVTTIEVSGENRVIRSCGKLESYVGEKKDYCFDADNEGYKQTICTCYEDGCNAAPPRLATGDHMTMLSATGLCVLVARLLRISA